MKSINFLERRRRLIQFGLLYFISMAAIATAFLLLTQNRQNVEAAGSGPLPPSDSHIAGDDSLRVELALAILKIRKKDSVIAMLRSRPPATVASLPTGQIPKAPPADDRMLERLRNENAAVQDSLLELQMENSDLQQKLETAQSALDDLSRQLKESRRTNQALQNKLNEASHGAPRKTNHL